VYLPLHHAATASGAMQPMRDATLGVLIALGAAATNIAFACDGASDGDGDAKGKGVHSAVTPGWSLA
jgi:hypothetical protein